jgi:hypothetical protein
MPKHAEFSVDNDMARLAKPSCRARTELGTSNSRDGEVHGNIQASAQNKTEASCWISIGLRKEASARVIDDGLDLDIKAPTLTRSAQDISEILANQPLICKEALAHRTKLSATKRRLPVHLLVRPPLDTVVY